MKKNSGFPSLSSGFPIKPRDVGVSELPWVGVSLYSPCPMMWKLFFFLLLLLLPQLVPAEDPHYCYGISWRDAKTMRSDLSREEMMCLLDMIKDQAAVNICVRWRVWFEQDPWGCYEEHVINRWHAYLTMVFVSLLCACLLGVYALYRLLCCCGRLY